VRVLMLASEYPPAKVFGLGRAVHDLSRALAAGGAEVHVLTNSIGGRDREATVEGVHLHRINYPNPPQPPDPTSCVVQFNLCLIERAEQMFAGVGPFSVLHAHDWLVGLAAHALRRRYGLPLVTTVHDVAVGKYLGRLDRDQQYISFTERWLGKISDCIICCSEHVKQELVSCYRADAARVEVIPCGVDPAAFDAEVNLDAFRSVFARPDERLLLYVGRLDPEKGVQTLLDAFGRLAAARRELRLVVVGEGKLRPGLQQEAAGLGLGERVTFLGYVAPPALAAVYRMAEVVVVPSLYEPFGLVALEAMASGTPVVASSAGGLAEIITEEVGLLVPPGNAEALAQAIACVLDDASCSNRLAAAGRARVAAHYGWGGIATKTAEVYARAVVNRGGDDDQRP
jgi:glycosyltransferase involved in cell wall biosynthesis